MLPAPDGTFERESRSIAHLPACGVAQRRLSSEQFARDMARPAGHPAACAPLARKLRILF
jgi:hypothetical protein